MRVLAIDPGPEKSAWVVYDGDDHAVHDHGITLNDVLLDEIEACHEWDFAPEQCAIEMVASYGMAVGAEIFETVYWLGRMAERWVAHSPHAFEAELVFRRAVKLHLCGVANAKDSNIRQALVDKFGGKELAIGKKAKPGPLHGIKADEWQALALAVTYVETRMQSKEAA